MPSDVQVFVRFKEQCVFAGEELNCVITFKNVAEQLEPQTPRFESYRHTKRNSISQLAAAQALALASPNSPSTTNNARSPNLGRSERTVPLRKGSSSLSNPATPALQDLSASDDTTASGVKSHHKRSVSIISGTSPILPQAVQDAKAARGGGKPGHRRSSTMTLLEYGRRPSQSERQLSADFRTNRGGGRRSPLSASHSPSDPEREAVPDFKFPMERTPSQTASEKPRTAPPSAMPRMSHRRDPSVTSRATETRTSVDIYSHSNHSGETLASEQVSMISERPSRPRMPSEMIRKHYKMAGTASQRKAQATTLLMGYAQINATFTLDASLVDQTPFEEVKKKGFLGGQSGGGVVGVSRKKPRPSSGLFGGFNFASIGESLESIMGGESSSVKEMKAVTNSRAIPLLSTPQSLLFVDAHLEPGDEKSFSFSFRLPRGLPASHKGKAIKILYNLMIGVQGAPGAQQQVTDMRQISVPFRVYPCIDLDGEILGHDLMQPHVILKDLARTSQINDPSGDKNPRSPTAHELDESNGKFLEFVDKLLDRRQRRQSSSSIIMDSLQNHNSHALSSQSEAIKSIDRAIMMSNQVAGAHGSSTSPNRFEIASGGRRIAVVTLDRPLHRLGETVSVVVDFSQSEVVCSSLRATLETCEKVNASLAVRSAATISRITRKVYASLAENILFTQRAVFAPTIPVLVTPSFVTSGVSLDWLIKLEFGTIREQDDKTASSPDGDDESTVGGKPRLLEELVNDERGILDVAVESLDCDTFEVTIPMTVYGDIAQDGTGTLDNISGLPI